MTKRKEVARVLREAAERLLENKTLWCVNAIHATEHSPKTKERAAQVFDSVFFGYPDEVFDNPDMKSGKEHRTMFALFVAEAYERGDL